MKDACDEARWVLRQMDVDVLAMLPRISDKLAAADEPPAGYPI